MLGALWLSLQHLARRGGCLTGLALLILGLSAGLNGLALARKSAIQQQQTSTTKALH